MQEMKDESNVPFTKGPGDVPSDSKKKGRLFIILGAVLIIIILVVIIIVVATSKSGGDEGSKNPDKQEEPEETFEPKAGEEDIFLVGKYDVDSTENPTKLISLYSMPPSYKEYTPLISSIYIDDEKANVDGYGQFQFKTNGTHKVEIYFKKDLEFIDGFFATSPVTKVYFTHIDASKITTMSGLFRGCYKLKKIYYGDKFNTKSLTNMDSLFSGCKAFTEIDLSQFDTSNVVNMDSLFDYSDNLK
jgi:surface protein